MPLLLVYIDVYLSKNDSDAIRSIIRFAIIHVCFWFRQSVSLIPDFVMIVQAVVSIGLDTGNSLSFWESFLFLASAERRRQRRLRAYRSDTERIAINRLKRPDGISQTYSRDYFIHYPGLDVHVCEFGKGVGHVNLVFLHQFGSGTFTFSESAGIFLQKYPEKVNKLISFDRVGFGTTSRPDEGGSVVISGKKMHAYDSQLSAVLTKELIGSEPTVLVGCGVGGLIALEAVSSQIDQSVLGMILISPTNEGFPRVVRSAVSSKVGRAVSLALLKAELGDFLVKRGWTQGSNVPDILLDKYRNVMRMPGWGSALIAVLKNWKNTEISTKKFPVLVISGGKDKIVSESEVRKFATDLSMQSDSVVLKSIAHFGHVPQEEFPADFAQVLAEFLDQIQSNTIV